MRLSQFDMPHLSMGSLASPEEDPQRLILVKAFDADKLRWTGEYEPVHPHTAVSVFWWEHRYLSASAIGLFISRANLPTLNQFITQESDTLHHIVEAINKRELVGMRPTGKKPVESDPLLQQRQLVRQIEAHPQGRLNEGGRQYKLVPGLDLQGLANRDDYQVVARAEAGRVLSELAKQATPDLAAHLTKAIETLSPDWRKPDLPEGMVCLRRIQARMAPAKSVEPAITPSQLRAMMEKAILEIHMVDLDGKDQPGLAYNIQIPDGGSAEGKLDKEGRGRARSSAPGVFTVIFPDLDGADWDGNGTLDLPPEEQRSEASKYEVKQGDRLPTIASKMGFARWRTVWDFAGNRDLRDLRTNPHILFPGDRVSIPSKLARKAEVEGGQAEYVIQSRREILCVRFVEADSSWNGPVRFKTTPDSGDVIDGLLSDDGTMRIDLPPFANTVKVELLWENEQEPFASHELLVGHLDPASEVSGMQARLSNLGYYDGESHGNLDDETRQAIIRFRQARLGDDESDADAGFMASLRKTHMV